MAAVMALIIPLSSLLQVNAAEDLVPFISGSDYIYEVEDGVLSGDAVISTDVNGFSGTGYVNIASGSVTLNVDVPVAGKYRVFLTGSTENNTNDKCEFVTVNSESRKLVLLKSADYGTWAKYEIGQEAYPDGVLTPEPVTEGYMMAKGHNTVTIKANWGYAFYDRLILTPADEAAAKILTVISLIDALPTNIKESNRYDVNYAKKAYDALDKNQRAQVTNYSKLEAALKALIQNPKKEGEQLIYEAECSDFLGEGGYVDNKFAGYSGTGYAFVMTDGFQMKINVPKAGKYRLIVAGANDKNGARCEMISVNGGKNYFIATPASPARTWILSEPGTENWVNDELKPEPVKGGFYFKAGENSVKITANWGYAAYDRIILIPYKSEALVDVDNIKTLNSLIKKLPEKITADDKKDVKKAWDLYNALSKKDKKGVKNVNKLFCAKAAIAALKADPDAPKGSMRFECEEGKLKGNTAVVTDKKVFKKYSGSGYVFLFDKSLTVDVYVPKSGYYDISIVSGPTEKGNKCDFVSVNGGEKYLLSTVGGKGVWTTSQPGTEFWENGVLIPKVPTGGFYLKEGKNTVTISANWGYCAYDSIIVSPYGTAPKTGDNLFPVAMTGLMMLVSAVAFVLVVVEKRKEKDYAVSNNQ